MSLSPVDQRLSELRARTEGIRPRSGFQSRIMLAVAQAGANAFRVELARAGRWFVPVALAVTLLAVGWASGTDSATSEEVAQAEISWALSW
jgi:hypothetical protein